MTRVTSSRLRNFAYAKRNPQPGELLPPSRDEWISMAGELLELRRVADLAHMHVVGLDAPDRPEDAVDGAFHQRELDETEDKFREAVDAYRKGK
jgi:hypothetical protein